jgi:hypothetical protein
MAADTSGASAQNTQTSSVRTGSDGPAKRGLKFRKPKSGLKTLLYALLVVVVLTFGWLTIKQVFHVGDKVYAQAAGHKIYKEDIKDLIGDTKDVSDHEAATILADKYLTEAMAKKVKISVSDQDIKAAYGQDIETQKAQDKIYYQRKVNQLYFTKLDAANRGIYKGEYLVANFNRNIAYPSPLLAEQQAHNPNLGNPKVIAADKKYAKDFITKLYDQIVSHKLSFAQAIKAEHENPQVGVSTYPTQPHSGIFDTTNAYASFLTADVTKKKLTTIKAGETTKPFVAGTSSGDDKGTLGSYYLVIRMNEAKGGSGMPFDQYLQQAKQKFGYKVNV